MDINSELFDKKSLSDIMKDVYDNVGSRRKQVDGLVEVLTKLVSDHSDATVVVPLIKEYLDIGVRSEEQLVKLVAVVQRMIAADAKGLEDSGVLTEDEKAELRKIQEEDEQLGKDLPAPNAIPLVSDSQSS